MVGRREEKKKAASFRREGGREKCRFTSGFTTNANTPLLFPPASVDTLHRLDSRHPASLPAASVRVRSGSRSTPLLSGILPAHIPIGET